MQAQPSSKDFVLKAIAQLVGEEGARLATETGRIIVTTAKALQEAGTAGLYRLNPDHALASMTADPGFREMLATQRTKDRRALQSIGDVDECAIVQKVIEGPPKRTEQRWKMILRDASEPGNWRTQSFDAKGINGHLSFNTKEEAIADAAQGGYTLRDDEALDRIQDTPLFRRGMYAADLIQQVNTGQLKFAAADQLLATYDAAQGIVASIAKEGAQAFVPHEGGPIYLLADRIQQGNEAAVFLHEIVHRYGKPVLRTHGFNRLVATLESWSGRETGSVERTIFDKAMTRARFAGKGQADAAQRRAVEKEELFAYAVEEAVALGVKPSAAALEDSAAGWLKSVSDTLTTAIQMATKVAPLRLDAQQLVDLSYALAQLENPQRMQEIFAAMRPSDRDALRGVLSRGGAAPWYSSLEAQIRACPQSRMPAREWAAWMAAQPGIKPGEIQWSGVTEWLDLQDEAVERDALANFVSANAVKMQTVTLSGGQEAADLLDVELEVEGFRVDYDPIEGKMEYSSSDAQGGEVSFDDLPWHVQDVVKAFEKRNPEPAKYAEYQLDGAKNYREVLLTLPTQEKAPMRLQYQLVSPSGDVEAVRADEPTEKWQARLKNGYRIKKTQVIDRQAMERSGQGGFITPHWDRLNVLAHVRINDRVDARGGKMLMVEEIQSDWAARARAEGVQETASVQSLAEMTRRHAELKTNREDARTALEGSRLLKQTNLYTQGTDADRIRIDSACQKAEERWLKFDSQLLDLAPEIEQLQAQLAQKAPAAPFIDKTSAWVGLAVKRMIKLAVDEGYDSVAFIDGNQAVERFKLSKSVQQLVWDQKNEKLYGTILGDLTSYPSTDTFLNVKDEADLVLHMGKDLAHQLATQPEDKGGRRTLLGESMKLGGAGMRAFYDKLVPTIARQVVKKFGGDGLETLESPENPAAGFKIWLPDVQSFHNRQFEKQGAATVFAAQVGGEVRPNTDTLRQPGFRITPAMRTKAAMGMPMFSLELESAVAAYAVNDDNVSPDLIEARRQCAQVIAKYLGTEQWMKAPNGEPTKLSQSQWVLVRTENFKNWFGDWENEPQHASMAVDGLTREPCVMYHGAREGGFAEFKPWMRTKGNVESTFFTSDRHVARSYAGTSNDAEIVEPDEDGYMESNPGIYAVFLNIRTPSISDFEGAHWDGSRHGQWMVKAGDDADDDFEPPLSDETGRVYFEGDEKHLAQALADANPGAEVVRADDSDETTNSVVADASRMRCDGAMIYDVVDEGKYGYSSTTSNVFAVFRQEQIKSATDNIGTFDRTSSDIRYSVQAQTETPSFRSWFGDSKVVDTSGKPQAVYHGTGGDFSVFDKRKANANFTQSLPGFYFTSAPKVDIEQGFGYGSTASEYANNAGGNPNVMPVYLRLTNPLVLDDAGEWGGAVMALDVRKADITRWVSQGGHDGVISYDKTGEDSERAFIAFNPEQIKSATGNNGDFDLANPDIRYSLAPGAQQVEVATGPAVPAAVPSYIGRRSAIPVEHTAAFKRWFGFSKVVHEDGTPKVMYHSTVAEFDKFKRKRNDVGMHFGTTGQAEDRFLLKMSRDPYGPALRGVQHATLPVYLSVKKPLRMPDIGLWDRDNIVSSLPAEFTLKECVKTRTMGEVRDLIKSHGYDGIVYGNDGETGGGARLREAQDEAWLEVYVAMPNHRGCFSPEDQKHPAYQKYSQACEAYKNFRQQNIEDSWIVLDPTQVKSALSNDGNYSSRNADIRCSMPVTNGIGPEDHSGGSQSRAEHHPSPNQFS